MSDFWNSGFGNFLSTINPIAMGLRGLGGNGMSPFWSGVGGMFDPANAYQSVGNASDVTQVNPYTDPYMQSLMGQGANTWNQLNQGMGSMTGMINSLDPMAAQNYFLQNGGGADQMRGIAQKNLAQYDTNRMDLANQLSKQAIDNISGQFADAGPGALRSGAASRAISEGAITPFLQANTDIANLMGQQAGQLQGQNMSNLFNSYLQNAQMGLGAQTAQNQMLAGMYGNQLGQQGAIAGPQWWQPTYDPNPNYMSIPDLIGTGADVAGMILPYLPM